MVLVANTRRLRAFQVRKSPSTTKVLRATLFSETRRFPMYGISADAGYSCVSVLLTASITEMLRHLFKTCLQ